MQDKDIWLPKLGHQLQLPEKAEMLEVFLKRCLLAIDAPRVLFLGCKPQVSGHLIKVVLCVWKWISGMGWLSFPNFLKRL